MLYYTTNPRIFQAVWRNRGGAVLIKSFSTNGRKATLPLHYSLLLITFQKIRTRRFSEKRRVKSEKVKNPYTRVCGFFGRRTWNRHARQGRGARVCLTAICRHFASKNANVAASRLRLAVISRYPLLLPNKKGTRCVPFLFGRGRRT